MKKTLVLLGSMCLSTHFAQVLSTSRYATGRSTSVYLLDTLGFFLQDHHSSINHSSIAVHHRIAILGSNLWCTMM
jgi:hypothetical protein